MEARRRRQDHRVQFGIVQQVGQAVAQVDAFLVAIGLRPRLASGATGGEGDLVAFAMDGIDEGLAPAAQPEGKFTKSISHACPVD